MSAHVSQCRLPPSKLKRLSPDGHLPGHGPLPDGRGSDATRDRTTFRGFAEPKRMKSPECSHTDRNQALGRLALCLLLLLPSIASAANFSAILQGQNAN